MKKLNKSFENVADQNVWEQQKEVETMLVIKVRTGRVYEILINVQIWPFIFSCPVKICDDLNKMLQPKVMFHMGVQFGSTF